MLSSGGSSWPYRLGFDRLETLISLLFDLIPPSARHRTFDDEAVAALGFVLQLFQTRGVEIMAIAPDTTPSCSPSRPQFGISAMMWTTFAVALALGYLRQVASPNMFATGAVVMATAVVVGGLFGLAVGRIGDSTYWSVVIAAAAFLSVAGDPAAPAMFRFAWSAVGIMAGAVCGAVAPRRLWRRVFLGTIAGGAGMGVCSLAMPVHDLEWVFDLICAPIVGGLVAVLIELILWLERERYSPRYITASWLLCAVIAGNLLVPWVLA